MLNSNDVLFMEDSVHDAIRMWDMTVSILKPLPPESQTHWNNNLHEYSGAICYDKYTNVHVERKDHTNMHLYDIDIDTGAGDSGAGRLIFTVSDMHTFIDETCRVLYNGSQWRIITIRKRIGESIIIIDEIIGSSEVWAETPTNIVDCGDV